MHAVETVDLTKTYNGVYAVQNVSLAVDEGDLLLIDGRSGSGKTTLLKLIGCLEKATSGTCTIFGKNIDAMTENELSDFRLNTMGFIFQDYNLLPTLTVYDNIELPLLLAGKEGRKKRVEDLLTAFDMSHLRDKRPDELSGGENQRVAILRALSNNPHIILADEPSSNLDIGNSHLIHETLSSINKEFGVTVIVVSHDPISRIHITKRYIMTEGVLRKE
ncbi:MAG: ABC transporter ATP-binding protein [Theionarchaea archaeon]|nr:ABC transporter ATP-binding protein [Theionarchaea archaeon]